MATYSVDAGSASGSSGSSDQTRANKVKFNQSILAAGIALGFGGSGSATAAPRIYSAAGVLLASGPAMSLSAASSKMSAQLPLTTPVRLVAGQSYWVGFYLSGSWSGISLWTESTIGLTYNATRAGVIMTYEGHGSASGDACPGGAYDSGMLWDRLFFDVFPEYTGRGFNAMQMGRRRRGLYIP